VNYKKEDLPNLGRPSFLLNAFLLITNDVYFLILQDSFSIVFKTAKRERGDGIGRKGGTKIFSSLSLL